MGTALKVQRAGSSESLVPHQGQQHRRLHRAQLASAPAIPSTPQLKAPTSKLIVRYLGGSYRGLSTGVIDVLEPGKLLVAKAWHFSGSFNPTHC